MSVAFPLVVDLSDGDQLHRLPLLQDPGALGELGQVLLDESLRGLGDGRVWEPVQRVELVLVVLEQFLPTN